MAAVSPTLPNKPGGSRFKQQTLPAWKPVFTANCVIPVFLIFGVIFIPVGVVLLLESNKISEMTLDYTNCTSSDFTSCTELRRDRSVQAMAQPCMCNVEFELTEDWTSTVYVYYRLTEFYQNHRRYLKSLNQEQLLGDVHTTSSCIPNAFKTAAGRPIVPCGMISNSRFNDSFTLLNNSITNSTEMLWQRDNIAWTEDIKYKFANPTAESGGFAGTHRPTYWQQNVSLLPGMLQNEDLAVWMRTAALPKFRKLYARIPGGLKRGNYTIQVQYNYPIKRGDKNIVLSTVGWIGGKNAFLAIAYLAVGGLSILGGCLLLVIYAMYGKKKQDVSKMH